MHGSAAPFPPRTAEPGRWHAAVWLGWYALATALLLWPLLLNADYLYFHDTAAYLRYPAEAFRLLFGIESDLSSALTISTGAPAATADGSSAVAIAVAIDDNGTVAAGRSIYYGVMLYAGALVGGLWVGVLAQLACVALALHMTLVALLGAERRRLFPLVVAALAVLTPLPFFVCYLMPDVFAGIAILAVANLFGLESRLEPGRRLLWLGLLAMALLFHTSHVAVALLMLAPAVAVSWLLSGRLPWRATATVALAVGIGLLGEILFVQVVESVYGAPPLRPPFLMAKLASGWHGHAYLTAACPEIGLRICDWLPRLPVDSDTFLWSLDPDRGVYEIADATTRRALDAEQLSFVTGVLTFDPLGQLVASLRDFAEQFGRFGLQEFAYDDSLRRKLPDMLPASERAAFVASALYRGRFPLGPADVAVHLTVAASVAYLLWAAIRSGRPAPGDESVVVLRIFAVVLIGGVVANAAVTGILSTPHDRYQARVIWLIPLLAMIVLARRRRSANAVAAGSPDRHARP